MENFIRICLMRVLIKNSNEIEIYHLESDLVPYKLIYQQNYNRTKLNKHLIFNVIN